MHEHAAVCWLAVGSVLCADVKGWTKCLHIIFIWFRHLPDIDAVPPVACFHSLAEVWSVSEATAGAESLMDGVQGSRTSAVAGHHHNPLNRAASLGLAPQCTQLLGCFSFRVPERKARGRRTNLKVLDAGI